MLYFIILMPVKLFKLDTMRSRAPYYPTHHKHVPKPNLNPILTKLLKQSFKLVRSDVLFSSELLKHHRERVFLFFWTPHTITQQCISPYLKDPEGMKLHKMQHDFCVEVEII